MNQVVRIDLSQDQGTPAGDFLAFLCCHTEALSMDKQHMWFFPYNGAKHTLYIKVDSEKFTIENVKAFIDMLEREYSGHPGCSDFVSRARMSIMKHL